MKKILDSGITVESDTFYKLLIWRDENRGKFRQFKKLNPLASDCLNLMDSATFSALEQFSDIKNYKFQTV